MVSALVLGTGLVLGAQAVAAAGTCGALWKDIDFNDAKESKGYDGEMAYSDWAPYSYLDGFYDDPSTKGTTNKRATVIHEGSNTVLDVLLPKGCVTSACAMQVKSGLPVELEEATLKYMMKFGKGFDWVRGGKLPGLCGADCITGCKDVTGLDGWSARQMWRPCNWPPEHPDNMLNCDGGKMTAYVYHMFKEHWCGDDFDFTNDEFTQTVATPRMAKAGKSKQISFMQPQDEEWYTITNYVKMNTAGPPGRPANYAQDGVLQTWIEGPYNDVPLLVLDKHNLAFRQYNNVSIDTLYFSVFFGGSNPTFEARKDEHIQFDSFKVWEGRCAPEAQAGGSMMGVVKPEWKGQRATPAPATLETEMTLATGFVGGGCPDIKIKNTSGRVCSDWEMDLHIRPTFGNVHATKQGSVKPMQPSGFTVLERDTEAGYFLIGPRDAYVQTIPANGSMNKIGFCMFNYLGARYLPEQFAGHIKTVARCTKWGTSPPVASTPKAPAPATKAPAPATKAPAPAPRAPAPAPRAPAPRAPATGSSSSNLASDIAAPKPATPSAVPASPGKTGPTCTGKALMPSYSGRYYMGKVCMDLEVMYHGGGACQAFNVMLKLKKGRLSAKDSYATRMRLEDAEEDSNEVFLIEPTYFKYMDCGMSHDTKICFADSGSEAMTEGEFDDSIEQLTATCTKFG